MHTTGLGPIDYVVIELPVGVDAVPAGVGAALLSMTESGMIRLLDLVLVRHDQERGLVVHEYEDLADTLPPHLGTYLAEILALEDLANIAPAVEPGRCAAVLVWEYICTRRLIDAAEDTDAHLVAQGRIPVRDIVASLTADN